MSTNGELDDGNRADVTAGGREEHGSSNKDHQHTPVQESTGINTLLLRRLYSLCPLLFPGLCSLPSVLFLLLLCTCFLGIIGCLIIINPYSRHCRL